MSVESSVEGWNQRREGRYTATFSGLIDKGSAGGWGKGYNSIWLDADTMASNEAFAKLGSSPAVECSYP